jgi:thiosulfate/3-mercaptopyruvate sulfurtransferase
MTQTFTHPNYLVETDWLHAHLDDPGVRILDATVYLRDGGVESGRANWEAGHIPNSTFIDLIDEISAPHPTLRFVAPSTEQFARVMGAHGVGDGTRVIVYDANNTMWATRVWWLLRAFGFDNAAVLNGGWKKWTLEGRPVSTEAVTPQTVTFNAHPRPHLFVGKDDVLREVENGAATTCLLNSLGESDFRSKRIPTSVNVPWGSLVDPTTGAYLPADTLRERFAPSGLAEKERVIVYCGSGISATSDAFILTLLGVPNVSVYDGSMQEWTADTSLPLVSDADPAAP